MEQPPETPAEDAVPTAIRKDNPETTVMTVRTTTVMTVRTTTVMTVLATTVMTVMTVLATTVTTARTAATTDIRGIRAIPGIQDALAIQARQTITTDFIQRHRRHAHTALSYDRFRVQCRRLRSDHVLPHLC